MIKTADSYKAQVSQILCTVNQSLHLKLSMYSKMRLDGKPTQQVVKATPVWNWRED